MSNQSSDSGDLNVEVKTDPNLNSRPRRRRPQVPPLVSGAENARLFDKALIQAHREFSPENSIQNSDVTAFTQLRWGYERFHSLASLDLNTRLSGGLSKVGKDSANRLLLATRASLTNGPYEHFLKNYILFVKTSGSVANRIEKWSAPPKLGKPSGKDSK